jgi:hypothetical protein
LDLRYQNYVKNDFVKRGSCYNLDIDFGSWTLDSGFCIIGLHRLDSTSAAGDGLVAISRIVVTCSYGTEYTLSHWHRSHANNEQCIEHAGNCARMHKELNAVVYSKAF